MLSNLRLRTLRSSVVLALSVLMAAVAVMPASAADVTAANTVSGGTLAFGAVDAPTVAVTLDGTDQTVTDPFDMNVNDARGTGAGWSVSITSTTFATTGGKTLSTSASKITGTSAVCDAGTCTDPTNSVAYPVTVPAATVAPAAVKIYNAAVDTGMGDFTVTPTLSVAVPANAYAGTYNSTVTLTIAETP